MATPRTTSKGIEVYQDRLILYGCGDFLNDYEGIGGYEHYRSDLGLMYFAEPKSRDRKAGSITYDSYSDPAFEGQSCVEPWCILACPGLEQRGKEAWDKSRIVERQHTGA